MDMKDALLRYKAQIASNKRRKDKNGLQIEVRLTFEEWCDIWEQSGKWEQRGHGGEQFCMTRINDLGHYEIGNVVIKTVRENQLDAHLGAKHRPESKDAIGRSNAIALGYPCTLDGINVFPSKIALARVYGHGISGKKSPLLRMV